MDIQNVIDIEVNDEQILKFVELMKQQQAMTKQMPAEWRAGAAAIADATAEMDEVRATRDAEVCP